MRTALPLLLIAGHFGLCLLAWHLGFTERRPVASHDPQTAFGGVFFLYWATTFWLAGRHEDHNWLFRFLNARGHAMFLAVVFGVLGVVLFLIGTGIFGGS